MQPFVFPAWLLISEPRQRPQGPKGDRFLTLFFENGGPPGLSKTMTFLARQDVAAARWIELRVRGATLCHKDALLGLNAIQRAAAAS